MERGIIFQKINDLRLNLQRLQEELELLRETVLCQDVTLQEMIKRRGLEIHQYNPADNLIFPPDFPIKNQMKIYQFLRHYSFRLFVRDLIKKKDYFKISDLTHYCSEDSAREYILKLKECGIIEDVGKDSYRLIHGPIFSFGATLEWFIAEIYKREFLSPSIYGVRFKGSPVGGDYDVIALFEGNLVYTEVKSAPPRGIEQDEILSFFKRLNDLLPNVAIFFVDTELRMKDKVVPMFEEAIKDLWGKKRATENIPVRLYQEIFHVGNRLFITNSKRDVVANLRRCLRHYLKFCRSAIMDISWK
jgi:regulator of replication initiation timing